MRYLRGRDDIRSDAVGLIGHSEGGIVVQLVARDDPELAFIVMIAGPGVRGDSVLALQVDALNRAAGLPDSAVEANARIQRRLMDIALSDADAEAMRGQVVAAFAEMAPAVPESQARRQAAALTSPWMRWFLAYDPAPVLRRLTLPVLAINGSNDLQVLAGPNLDAIAGALEEAGNEDYDVLELDGLNHLLQTSETGAVSEYRKIEETIAPTALEVIGDWIEARTGG